MDLPQTDGRTVGQRGGRADGRTGGRVQLLIRAADWPSARTVPAGFCRRDSDKRAGKQSLQPRGSCCSVNPGLLSELCSSGGAGLEEVLAGDSVLQVNPHVSKPPQQACVGA